MASTIQIRRGLEAARTGITPAEGELVYTTDGDRVWIGDGSTAGGIDFISNNPIPVANIDGTQNNIVTFDGSGDASLVSGSANEVLTLNGSGVPTFAGVTSTNINSGDFITDLSTVPGANKFVDAATIRAYVLQQVQSGFSWRPPVDYRDNTNTDLTAVIGQTTYTPDGVATVNGDRVLWTNEATAGEDNRVYLVGGVGSSITLTLETDGQAGNGDPTDGDTLFVQAGTAFADQTYTYNGTDWVLAASLNGALLASNNLSDVANAVTSLSNIGGIGAATTDTLTNKTMVSTNAGGTNPLTVDHLDIAAETAGDIFFWTTGGAASKLTVGSNGQVLTVSAGLPVWAAAAGTGDVNGPGSATDNGLVRFD